MGFGVASSVPAVFMKLDEEDLSLANWHHEKTASSHHGLALVSAFLLLALALFLRMSAVGLEVFGGTGQPLRLEG